MQEAVPRLLIAGTNSGCGKTTVTCAILQALVDGGVSVAAAKCGPDYIDPMFHREIIGAKSSNLDPFFFDDDTLRFIDYVNHEPAIRAILAGHLHFDFEDALPSDIPQIVTGGGFRDCAREITFR